MESTSYHVIQDDATSPLDISMNSNSMTTKSKRKKQQNKIVIKKNKNETKITFFDVKFKNVEKWNVGCDQILEAD